MKCFQAALLLWLAWAIPASAQDVFSHPLNDRTHREVKTVTQRLASRPVIKADFRQTKTVARLSRTFISTGTMIFSVERGLLWQVQTPVAGATVMTRNRIAQKSPSGRISVIAGGAHDTFRRFAAIMQAVFSGDDILIEKEFNVFFRRTGGRRWEIGLVPKDTTVKGVIASLEIRGDDDLDGFVLREAGGDHVEYSFSRITYPATLSPADEKAFF